MSCNVLLLLGRSRRQSNLGLVVLVQVQLCQEDLELKNKVEKIKVIDSILNFMKTFGVKLVLGVHPPNLNVAAKPLREKV